MRLVLTNIWRWEVTVSSNFARAHAVCIAAMASIGFITTKVGRKLYTNQWHITVPGLGWLGDNEEQ